MEWNNLRSTTIHPGKLLVIYKTEKVYLPEKPEVAQQTQEEEKKEDTQSFLYYEIQKGDTLWDIANEKGVSLDELKELNKNLNSSSLKPGDKIVIGKAG